MGFKTFSTCSAAFTDFLASFPFGINSRNVMLSGEAVLKTAS